MMLNSGVFIVLEGSDGSGKETQFKLLAARLEAVGYEVQVYDFPQYDKPSAHFIKKYLNGEYGPASQVNPYTASMFYALDRYEASSGIKKALDEGKIVLSNRYAGSNMAHQGSKFGTDAQRRGFFIWEDSLEYQLLEIPRPDLNIYLRVPSHISYQLIASKNRRSYTKNIRDEHEQDINHLNQTVSSYDLLCKLFPKDFMEIDCAPKGSLLGIAEINNLLWLAIKPYLHERLSRTKPAAKSVMLHDTDNQYNSKTVSIQVNPRKTQVIKFNRISLLALSQLTGLEDATMVSTRRHLLTEKIEYFIPPSINSGTRKQLKKYFAELEINRGLVRKAIMKNGPAKQKQLYLDWADSQTIPMAAIVSTELVIPGRFDRFAQRAACSTFAELKLLTKIITPGYDITDNEHVDLLRQSSINNSSLAEKLIDYWPKNEVDLLTSFNYESSELSNDELALNLAETAYHKKADILKRYLLSLGSLDQLPRQPWYEFEVYLSWPSFRTLIDINLIEVKNRQLPNPRNGYSTPNFLDDCDATDKFLSCFDLSLSMYSSLQSAGQQEVSSYAALSGHRGRYLLKIDFSQILRFIQLKKTTINPEFIDLIRYVTEQVSLVHPHLSQYLANVDIDMKDNIDLQNQPLILPKTPSTQKDRIHSKSVRKTKKNK